MPKNSVGRLTNADSRPISRLTTLGRPVDWAYPTNRAITVIVLAVGFGFFAAHIAKGTAVLSAIESSGAAALAVFLTWALGREVDPDHDWTAFVAIILYLPFLAFKGAPSLAPLGWLLLTLRVINRTTGAPATIFDSGLMVMFGSWLSTQYGWGIGVLTATAFAVSGLIAPKSKAHLMFAGIALLAALGAAMFVHPASGHLKWRGSVVVAGLSVFMLPAIFIPSPLTSVGDLNQEFLDPARIRLAQVFALVAGICLAAGLGLSGLYLVLPLWASIVGTSLLWVVERIVKARRLV